MLTCRWCGPGWAPAGSGVISPAFPGHPTGYGAPPEAIVEELAEPVERLRKAEEQCPTSLLMITLVEVGAPTEVEMVDEVLSSVAAAPAEGRRRTWGTLTDRGQADAAECSTSSAAADHRRKSTIKAQQKDAGAGKEESAPAGKEECAVS